MGVSGSGKTTISRLLADALGWTFIDADDFHSSSNVEKMRRGIPLTEDDRKPRLDALIARLNGAPDTRIVLACSALTHAIRQRFREETSSEVVFVYLAVNAAQLRKRLIERKGHYAKVDLLESQLATLEEPHDAIVVHADGTVEETCQQAREKLARHRWSAS